MHRIILILAVPLIRCSHSIVDTGATRAKQTKKKETE